MKVTTPVIELKIPLEAASIHFTLLSLRWWKRPRSCRLVREIILINVKVKVAQSCPTLCNPKEWIGPNTRVGSLSLLQGIFPTQGSNPGLPHFRWILYQLSYKGSPRILEWVAYPFSSGSSWPRNQTGVSCIAGRLFTSEATRKARINYNSI